MTTGQEIIAEKIIQLHKDNKGTYDWVGFNEIFHSTNNDRHLIKHGLKDKVLIDDFNYGTRLTELGWTFNGFDAERQSVLTAQQRLKIKDESDKYDLKVKKWQVRFKWLPFIISGLSLIGTIVSIIIAYQALVAKQVQQDLQPVQKKIQELKKRVEVLESLPRTDIHPKKGK